MSHAFTPVSFGPLALKNRFIKSATNEGLSRDGLVTDGLIDFHRKVADGGAAMTTLAYCSVAAEGRTFRDQIYMRPDVLDGLKRLADSVHVGGAKLSLQLAHSGAMAPKKVTGTRPIGPSRNFNLYSRTLCRPITDSDLTKLIDDYKRAGELAISAGADALEVHLGHGYLLSQILSPKENRRKDEFGGSPEARAQIPIRVLQGLKSVVDGRLAVTAKLGMFDGYKGGIKTDQALQTAMLLEHSDTIDALVLTGGHSTKAPLVIMHGDNYVTELAKLQPNPAMRALMGAFAKRMRVREFTEAYFKDSAQKFKEATQLPLILLGGVTKLDTVNTAVAEGFAAVEMGRALLHDPQLVNKMQSGVVLESGCVPCNQCIVEMEKGGARCVRRDGQTITRTA